jgi:hypothetical protein
LSAPSAARYGCLLLPDEAHAVYTFGGNSVYFYFLKQSKQFTGNSTPPSTVLRVEVHVLASEELEYIPVYSKNLKYIPVYFKFLVER